MKKGALLIGVLFSLHVFGWGLTGHRTIGYIAEQHLSTKAKKEVEGILGHETLAEASNWMDDIKSDPKYDHAFNWHFVTIPDGKRYETTEKEPKGDIIATIERITGQLKADTLDANTEKEALKMLIHLVGDIHQPLHVGNGTDLGGNEVKVKWFWRNSNLHRIWDSEMIDGKQYSYTELANSINHVDQEQIKFWQTSNVREWAQEAQELRNQCYENIPDDNNLGYEYLYANWSTVEKQLLKGGIRLAGLLNGIYD